MKLKTKQNSASEAFFKVALLEAKKAADRNEVPIGAVLVKDGKIIAKAFNQTEKKQSFSAHAEILCINKATRKLKTKYLLGCSIYVSLEPCLMCRYAASLSRIESIHYLIESPAFGLKGKAYPALQVRMIDDIKNQLSQASRTLLQDFFRKKR